jgi:hypothetical protein
MSRTGRKRLPLYHNGGLLHSAAAELLASQPVSKMNKTGPSNWEGNGSEPATKYRESTGVFSEFFAEPSLTSSKHVEPLVPPLEAIAPSVDNRIKYAKQEANLSPADRPASAGPYRGR